MFSPRLARLIASVHNWLGLVMGPQLIVWTASGLFLAAIYITAMGGEHVLDPAGHSGPMDAAQIHLMDWGLNESFNTPWMVAAALLALSTAVLFAIALLTHRFTRGLARREAS